MSRPGRFAMIALAALCPSLAPLADPPDSTTNPVTGSIEIVDVVASGSDFHLRHTINPGQGQSLTVTELTTGPAIDVGPRIAIGSSGDAWITWWRDGATKQVLVRKRTASSGAWGAERLVSNPSQSSKRPEIVLDGTKAWIAYEYASGAATEIAIAGVIDSPDPIDIAIVASTAYTGNVDVQVSREAGHLWVTWIDGSSYVGWAEYAYGTGAWGQAHYEPYGSDTVSAARSRIRSGVLGS